MDLYNTSYDYFMSLIHETGVLFSVNIHYPSLSMFMFGILGAILLLNRKVKRLEKAQLNDIDDVTSFNRLINEEIGTLRKEHDEINQVLKKTEKKTETENGKLFNNAPYTQAVHLAQRGYARDEIISLCSLTESEAELIFALHANNKAA